MTDHERPRSRAISQRAITSFRHMQHAIGEYDNARTDEQKAAAAEHYMEAEREHFAEVLGEVKAERLVATSKIKRYVIYVIASAFALGAVVAFIVLPLLDVQSKTAGLMEVGPCRQAKERARRVFLRPGVLRSFAGRHDIDCNRQSRYVTLNACLQIDPPGDGDTSDWCRRVYAFFLSQPKPNAHPVQPKGRAGVVYRKGVVPRNSGQSVSGQPGGHVPPPPSSPPSTGPPSGSPTLSVPPVSVPGVGTTPQVNVCAQPGQPPLCN